MNVSSIAKRYAKAFFEIAAEKDRLEEIKKEFLSFLSLLKDETELRFLLEMPNVTQREKILLNFLKPRFSELFNHFLLVVLRNKRHDLLQQIFEDFQRRYDLKYNRFRAQAITAIPLTEKKLSELTQKVAAYFYAEVRIENIVDPSIIGGVIIRLNGKVYNASVTEQFKRLRHFLTKN